MSEILLHPLIIVPSTICVFLPWNVYIRLCLWTAFTFVAPLALLYLERADGYAVFGYMLLAFCAVVILVPAGAAQLLLRRAITGEWPAFSRHPSDCSFVWAFSGLGLTSFFLVSAFTVPEASDAFLRHVMFFAIAAGCAYSGRLVIALIAIVPGLFSLYHPVIVQNAAKDAAQGADFCLFLNQRKVFMKHWHQLTFLTMDKGDVSPHAYLIIETDPPTYAYWSYRKQVFDTEWRTEFADKTLRCPTD